MSEDSGALTKRLENVEAEAALLGAMLIDNELIEFAEERLEPEDFVIPLHQRMYAQMVSMRNQGKAASPVTLKPHFDDDPAMEQLGGVKYLAELTEDGLGLLAFRSILDQVVELSHVRQVLSSSRDMAEAYLSGDQSLVEAMSYLDDAMAARSGLTRNVPCSSAADMVDVVRERSDRITENMLGENLGLRCTTITDINNLLAPIEDGTYIVLGGRPSMGKTTVASSFAWGCAANGHPTLVLAAEGSRETLAMRFVADLSFDTDMPISHEQIRHDKLTREERAHFDALKEKAEALPIDFQVPGRCDVRRLRSYVSRAASRWKDEGRKLKLVVVDYLQLLQASANGREIDNDVKRVNAVSGALLSIAQEFEVTVVALSQLNRGLEQREDKRPRLSDLRESGRLEEDADVVMFVYREEYYLERSKPEPGRKGFEEEYDAWQADLARCRDRVDLILAKNRHGEVKTRTAKFFGKYSAVRGGDFEEKPIDYGDLYT